MKRLFGLCLLVTLECQAAHPCNTLRANLYAAGGYAPGEVFDAVVKCIRRYENRREMRRQMMPGQAGGYRPDFKMRIERYKTEADHESNE